MLKRSTGEKVFNVVNIFFFIIFTCMMLLPIVYVLKQSFEVGIGGSLNLSLLPAKFSGLYYQMVVKEESVYRPFLNSVYITIVGTSSSLLVNAIGAYTLSKRELPGSKAFIYFLVIFPMLFGGGLIPTYLLMRALGLIDRYAVLIIPAMASGWNMILIRNYYWSIPDSLAESARIDGAEEFTVFFRIILPLAKPVLAAIALFTGVGFWNTFMAAIIYIRSPQKYTFPVKLREMILIQATSMKDAQMWEAMLMAMGFDPAQTAVTADGLSSAMMIVSMLPIILIYPYLQKHFAAGIMVGSIKG
ncbi:MAG: carbohydrate ABC transporter permease [Clostridia bacterium]|nr:carbohydrate ABC transporter permease [Clostridia bacterium]